MKDLFYLNEIQWSILRRCPNLPWMKFSYLILHRNDCENIGAVFLNNDMTLHIINNASIMIFSNNGRDVTHL